MWKGPFEQLVERVREGADILRGRRKPSRSFAFEEALTDRELAEAADRLFLELDRREQAYEGSSAQEAPRSV